MLNHVESVEEHDLVGSEETSSLLVSTDFISSKPTARGAEKQSLKTSSGNLSSIGIIFAMFALYSIRFVVCPWLLLSQNDGMFSLFIPILSPVYRQAEHWKAGLEKACILIHVFFGAAMLVLGTLQFDKKLRQGHKSLHRWCGRVYVVCGVISLIALNGLRGSFGAGSAPKGSRSETLTVFVDVACGLWLGATLLAVRAARQGDHPRHRDLMFFSITLAATPIAQRVMSWTFMTPNAMMLRCLVCTVRGYHSSSTSSPSPDHFLRAVLLTHWGEPGSSSSLLLGSCAPPDHSLLGSDPRSRPLVFSLDGYGEGEQASFALSAWLGLCLMLCANAPRLWRRWRLWHHEHRTATLPLSPSDHTGSGIKSFTTMRLLADRDGEHLSSLRWGDIWRTLRSSLRVMVLDKPWAQLQSSSWRVTRQPCAEGLVAGVVHSGALLAVATSTLMGAVLTILVMSAMTLCLSAAYTIAVGGVLFYVKIWLEGTSRTVEQ